jgi:hypothetical protein
LIKMLAPTQIHRKLMNVCLKWKEIVLGQENELLLMSVLDCLYNAVSQILRKNVDKKSLFDNLEVRVFSVPVPLCR